MGQSNLAKREEETEKQGEWIRIKEGGSKTVKSPKVVNVKNRFSILILQLVFQLGIWKMEQIIWFQEIH